MTERRLGWLLSALLPITAAAQSRTVLDAVYSDAQAMRGEAVYSSNCAKCHEGADVDGPPLNGDPFIDRWREDSLAALFTFIKSRMPRDAPGKLSNDNYRDIVAFLLAANDYPAGAKELGADQLASTLLVGKDGPKPLPTNALVLAVGCLASGGADTWTLTSATAHARARETNQTTPEELKSSAAKPAGNQTFRLQNLADLPGGFRAEAYRSQRVQVKGVLVHQSGGDRIHVTSLAAATPGCAA